MFWFRDVGVFCNLIGKIIIIIITTRTTISEKIMGKEHRISLNLHLVLIYD